MDIDVALVDNLAVALDHLAEHLRPATRVTIDHKAVTCKWRKIIPVTRRDDPSQVDTEATLQEILKVRPGVAVIDLKLQGDAVDDYSGADLSLRLRAACNDCSIVLVSSYFEEAPRLLDEIEIFRFRVDRLRPKYGQVLRSQFKKALRQHFHALALRSLLEKAASPGGQRGVSHSHAVYISYARDDPGAPAPGREEFVNRMEDSLRQNGYGVRRDRTTLGYTGLISEFIGEIGRGKCVVVVVSDKYLSSPFCMYELYQVYDNDEFGERVCPVVLPGADLTPSGILRCVDFWSREFAHLEKQHARIKPSVITHELLGALHRYRDISDAAGEMLSFIANMNSRTPEELQKDDFAILRKRIDEILNQ